MNFDFFLKKNFLLKIFVNFELLILKKIIMKKLLFSFLFSVVFGLFSSQSIGLSGDFNSWGYEVLTTTDNITYTKTVTFSVSGSAKFRQNSTNWDTNWGANTFPSGTGTQNGANIPVPAGTYNVTFNRTTGAYNFVSTIVSDNISFYGGFNSNATPGESLSTPDGINYSKTDFYFNAANVKFYKSNAPIKTWGGTTFPSGTAVENGGNIPLTSGYYNITFNKNTLAYSFQEAPVTLIGNGISGGSWTKDVVLTSTDGGKTFTKSGLQLVAGGVKFRVNNAWVTSWGGKAFPSGTGALNSDDNIPTTPGTYDVTFNRLTGEYAFTVSTLATGETVKKSKSFVSEGKLYTNKQGNLSVQVVDFSGRVIKNISAKASTNGIELNLPKKGNYILKLNDEVIKFAY